MVSRNDFLREKGFTLIELIIVVAIIGILSAIVFTNLRNNTNQTEVEGNVSQIKDVFVKAREYAVAGRLEGGLVASGGYGVYVDTSDAGANDTLVLFADMDGNGIYDNGEDMESIEFSGFVFTNVGPGNLDQASVVFTLPSGRVKINGSELDGENAVVSFNDSLGDSRKLEISPEGRIEIK